MNLKIVLTLLLNFVFFASFAKTLNCNPLIITGEIIHENNCGNGPNGSINITVTGGTAPYTFAWTNSSTTEDLINISAGIYGVNVIDAQGCTGAIGFQVNSVSPMVLTDASIYPTCSGVLGTGIVTITGGNPPYSFEWSNGDLDSIAENLTNGNYFVEVTDNSGCLDTLFVEVENNPELQVFPIITNANCYSDSGAVSLYILGGTPPYSINWNGIDSTKIPPGIHNVEVSDIGGCNKITSYQITSKPEILVDITKTIVNCDSNSYHVEASVSGGVPPYTFNWSFTDSTNVKDGNHTLNIVDASNCEITENIEILPALPLNITHTYSPITCTSTEADVTINITGGVEPYTIIWPDSTKNIYTHTIQLDSSKIVEIKDARNCISLYEIEIDPAEEIKVDFNISDATCEEKNGEIYFTVSGGGTTNYSILINGESVVSTNVLVDTGTYNFTVSEPSGCSFDTVIKIKNNGFVQILDSYVTHNICSEDKDGSVSVKAWGEELSYLWSTGDTLPNINNLIGGNYSLTITDKYGCTFDSTFVVNSGKKIHVNFVENYDPCINDVGTLTAYAYNGISPYTYLWENGADTSFIDIDEPGEYEVTVTDSLGCSVSYSYLVKGDELGGSICFKAPNAFSPNNDGINDLFEILGIYLFPDNKLEVYNRWGKIVFEENGYKGDWDGTIDGEPLEMGSYYYVLSLNNSKNTVIQSELIIKR